MDKLIKNLNNISLEEISNISPKIRGISYLEILKFKLLERIPELIENIDLEKISEFEHNDKNLNKEKEFEINLNFFKQQKVLLGTTLDKDLLLISYNQFVKIDVEDSSSKKLINLLLMPKNGICLPKNTKYNINFQKNSLILKIFSHDRVLIVENEE
tara:strand:+ start:933 stop:1403 length:471 start_codon:yes stop_codon:yes gene_type:complete